MEKLTEKEYFKMDNGIVQNITDEFIRPHIKHYQSNFVYDMQQEGVEGFSWDYVENQYHSKEEILEDFGDNKEEMTEEEIENLVYENPKEIFEWYLVSSWFLGRLKEINEPYIVNDYGNYWGRCCTGQAICLDYTMQKLAYQYSNDERLFKQEVKRMWGDRIINTFTPQT